MYKLALIWTSPLLYHIWPSMQQIPLKIIYTSPNMSCPILWELWICTCAMMGPMVMAFMAILTSLWSSHKQKTIAQSISEAEYMALADAANQAVWYWGFLKELGYTIEDAVPPHGDNKGAVDLALNPVTSHWSKHINIKHHVIYKYIEDGQISLICTPTEEMVVDGFTKLLSCTLLLHFNPNMGLCAQ